MSIRVMVGSGFLALSALACGGDESTKPDCPVVITAPSDSVVVHPTETIALQVFAKDCNNQPASPVTYSSGNENIATVSGTGYATGLAFGKTTLTATAGGTHHDIVIGVIGHPFASTVDTTPLNMAPYGVAISTNDVVYVTQLSSNIMSRGTIPLDTLENPVTVGAGPAHVAFNPAGTKAYVTNQGGHSVSVVDVATNLETTQVPLGPEAFNVIVSLDGGTVYASSDVGTIYLISTASNTVVDSFAAGAVANGLALSPDGNRLYASSRDAGQVVIFDTQAEVVLDTLMTGNGNQRMAVSPDGSRLYIANENLGLDIWNLTTAARDTTISMDAYGLAMSPDGAVIYVAGSSAGTITIVDRHSRSIVTTITTLGFPRNVAFSRYGQQALITDESGFVTIIR
jgi:YVTN family beta-propeller protein